MKMKAQLSSILTTLLLAFSTNEFISHIPKAVAVRLQPTPNQKRFRRNQRVQAEEVVIVEEVAVAKIGDSRQLSRTSVVIYGMILALNSGYINGICLSGLICSTKQAGAAVTGAWTNSAIGFATNSYDMFTFNAKCILSYMSGSFISGFLNPHTPTKPFDVPISSTRVSFLISAALMYAATEVSGASSTDVASSFILLGLAACGIQNSLSSTITGNLVRSAHLSGTTSDIGTFIGQCIRGNKDNLEKLRVLLLLAGSFWSGGVLSYEMVTHCGREALLLSAALYLLLGIGVSFL